MHHAPALRHGIDQQQPAAAHVLEGGRSGRLESRSGIRHLHPHPARRDRHLETDVLAGPERGVPDAVGDELADQQPCRAERVLVHGVSRLFQGAAGQPGGRGVGRKLRPHQRAPSEGLLGHQPGLADQDALQLAAGLVSRSIPLHDALQLALHEALQLAWSEPVARLQLALHDALQLASGVPSR